MALSIGEGDNIAKKLKKIAAQNQDKAKERYNEERREVQEFVVRVVAQATNAAEQGYFRCQLVTVPGEYPAFKNIWSIFEELKDLGFKIENDNGRLPWPDTVITWG